MYSHRGSCPQGTPCTVSQTITELTCFCALLNKHVILPAQYMNDKAFVVFFIAQQFARKLNSLFTLRGAKDRKKFSLSSSVNGPLRHRFADHTRHRFRLVHVNCTFYRPQTKFAKVMFLQVSVCPHGRGACMVLFGGHVWWFY